ncbi:MAG: RNA polymerase sigma factor [Planctomycetota bacterium]
MAHEDDARLVRRACEGDAQAASEIVERYQRPIFAVCFRILGDEDAAAELTQETLIKVLTGLEKFHGRSALSTWAYRIAVNACYTHLRSERVRSASRSAWPEDGEPEAARGVQRGGDGLDVAERRRLVARGLQMLQPDHRVVLVLRDVQGLEYEQIAGVLGVAVGTVKSKLFRARAALRSVIEDLERSRSGVRASQGDDHG